MSISESRGLFGEFLRTARDAAARPAFTFLDAHLAASSYTFEQLLACVDQLARRLSRARPDPALPIAILVSSQEGQVLHCLAAMSLGLTPAILTPPHRKLNRAYYLATTRAIFDHARFSAVITDLGDVESPIATLQAYTLHALKAGGREPARTQTSVEGSAFLQFSSGTTGIKRGVLVSNAAALAQIRAYAEAIDLSTRDSIVSWLPLYHDMGFITSLQMPLARGVHATMIQPIDWVTNPALYLEAVSRFGGTLGWHPNFAFAFMADRVREVDLGGLDLSSLRGLVNCSEPPTKQSQDHFTRRFRGLGLSPSVFQGCYAMAETTFAMTHGRCTDAAYLDGTGATGFPPRSWAEPFVSVGRPLEGVDVIVTDNDGRALPDRCVGELWVKSPFNATGYYDDPVATAAAFRDGWHRTGDLGYRAGDVLYVCGRRKDLLIVGGVNIVPHDVEDAVADIPDVHPGRVSVFGDFDANTQTERMTILAETSAAPEQQPDIVARIRQRVAAEFQAAGFDVSLVPLGWLVKSSAGKMARRANREKWLEWRSSAR